MNVDRPNAVSIGKAKVFVEIPCNPLEPPTGLAVVTRVHQRNAPRLRFLLVYLYRFGGKVDGDFGLMQKVVVKKLFNEVAIVATAGNAVRDAMGGIYLHKMPKSRSPANFYHGLWACCTFLSNMGAGTVGEEDHLLHIKTSLSPRSDIQIGGVPKHSLRATKLHET